MDEVKEIHEVTNIGDNYNYNKHIYFDKDKNISFYKLGTLDKPLSDLQETWEWTDQKYSTLDINTSMVTGNQLNMIIGNGFIITEIYRTNIDNKKIEEQYFIVVINDYDNSSKVKGDIICAMLVNYNFFNNPIIVIPKEQIKGEKDENYTGYIFAILINKENYDKKIGWGKSEEEREVAVFDLSNFEFEPFGVQNFNLNDLITSSDYEWHYRTFYEKNISEIETNTNKP